MTFERSLDDEELAERYRGAHAFLCLSEHEGFCIPLLEAFHFGVPVVARPAGGDPGGRGRRGAAARRTRDLAVVAELVHLAIDDAELRGELRGRGRARLAAFAPEKVAADPARRDREPVSAGLQTGARLAERVAEIDWFHSIELAPGLKTRGSDDTARRVDILQIPEDLTGKTVLDVGAWDGFFSFEAERRGAARVVALDSHRLARPRRGPRQGGVRPRARSARVSGWRT